MSEIKRTTAGDARDERAAWVAPTLTLLSVSDTAMNAVTGADGNATANSTMS